MSFAGIDSTGRCNWVQDGTYGTTAGSVVANSSYNAVIQDLVAARDQQNPNVLITLSVGGQTLSFYFSDAVTNDPYKLASSCVDMMNNLGLDGIDYDWEYPTKLGFANCPQGKTCSRSSDKPNFVKLLQHTRSLLDSSAPMGRQAPLSAATAYITDYYDVPGMDAYLTTWNVMNYEYGGCWSSTTQHNAPVSSSINSLAAFASSGATKSKLILGVPYYSNKFYGADTSAAGGRKSSCKTVDFGSIYSTCNGSSCSIVSTYKSGALDARACYCSDSGIWASYDDSRMMQAKSLAVIANGFGGILAWSIPGDYQNLLTDSIYAYIRPAYPQRAAGDMAMTLSEFVAIIP